MTRKTIFKIKDSVDLFLSNNRYLMVYYMNSRQRKSFRVNDEMIHLLENILVLQLRLKLLLTG